MANRPGFAIQTKTSLQNGSIVEEHWVIHSFFPETLDEVLRHLNLLRTLKRTGQVTINLSQGGLGAMEYRERGSKILTNSLDNGS